MTKKQVTKKETQADTVTDNGVDLSNVDPFDPANFMATPEQEMIAATRLLVSCKVGKPSSDVFVRAHNHPSMQLEAYILKLESTGEQYLLSPAAAESVLDMAKRVIITVAIDRQMNPFLWVTYPVPADGRDNSYWQTGRVAKELARTKWIRMKSNQAAKVYDIFEARIKIPEPDWPAHSLTDYLKAGFGENFTIVDPNDPVIRRLLGLA
jgi:hypothetical protein